MSLPELPKFRYRQPRMDYVEDVEQYVPGGYHPVDIDDVIGTDDKRYIVIHKLGFGGFSTVWLVRSCQDMRYFALKILRADVTNANELRILQHLKGLGSDHPNVVSLYDSFQIEGPNGSHHCLVFPALGPSLYNLSVAENLSGPVRHRVCQQIASGMAFLHQQGICHGDLTISNIVFELPDIRFMSPTGLCQLLGPIKAEKLRLPNGSYSPHAPKQVVQRPDLSGLDLSLLVNVRIVDFGQAFFANQPPTSLGIPIQCFPPEVCFGLPPSAGSDIWDLACVLYQVHGIAYLFPVFFPIFGILMGTIVGMLGPLPPRWKGRFMFDEYGYRERGQLKNVDRKEPPWWFEDQALEESMNARLFKSAPHLSAPQREEFAQLLLEMLAYEPEKRLSAINAVQRLKSAAFLDDN
ncbi:kinase domain-containing protein [Durotheca rogersii]|uniref:kinase domain-containing protein n=1 Tax=Durotheca rogersii TaxID=419775 RepID=UPI00221FFD24|nr:kinase domain-containing protein [Durotheca rogersii]KAI5860718.1 kinase domain-containing protein [Durotheca rogersii]